MTRRFLACLVSLSLLAGSVPPSCFAGIKFPHLDGVGGSHASPGVQFYQRLILLPEFSRNPLGAAYLTIQAAPVLRQYGPMTVKNGGGQILLTPEGSIEPVIALPIRDSFKASPSLVRLAQELDWAQNLDSSSLTDQLLQRFYEDEGFLDQPSEESPVPAVFLRQNDWAFLENKIAVQLGLKPGIGSIESWRQKTAEILRNKPETRLEAALMEAFSQTHPLNSRQTQEAKDLPHKSLLAPVDEARFMEKHGSERKTKTFILDSFIHSGGSFHKTYEFGRQLIQGRMQDYAAVRRYGLKREIDLPKSIGRLIWCMPLGEEIYVRTTRGIWRVQEFMEDLLPGWEDRILREIGGRIERDGKISESASAVPPLGTNEKGDIVGEDGRTIFSGFQNGMHLLLGLAGAGFLEGLSRLALSLGNLNLGFGEGKRDLWEALEETTAESLGLEAKPGKGTQWREAAAGILKSDFKLSLEEALAKAFSKVYQAGPEREKAVQALLSGENVPIRAEGRIFDASKIGDAFYLGTEGGVYVREKGGWKKTLEDMGPIGQIAEHDARAYLLAGREYSINGDIYEQKEGGKWERLPIRGEKDVEWFSVMNGELYASSFLQHGANGLYVLKKMGAWGRLIRFFLPGLSRWKRLIDGYVTSARILDGKLYVTVLREDDGSYGQSLWVREGEDWKMLSRNLAFGSVGLAVINGVLHIQADDKVFVRERDGRRMVFDGRQGHIFNMEAFQGRLYLATDSGVYRQTEKGWELESGLPRWVNGVHVINGELYATGSGFSVKKGNEWKTLLSLSKESFTNPRVVDGKIYLSDTSGRLWRWPSFSEDLPKGWREEAEASIGEKIKDMRRSEPDGFWPRWAELLEKECGIRLEAEDIREWQKQTFDILKGNFNQPLEKVLAEALFKVRPLDPGKKRLLEVFFKTGLLPELSAEGLAGPAIGDIKHSAVLDGRLYVAAEKGLYVLEKDGWKKLFGGFVNHVGMVDGKIAIAAGDAGRSVLEGGKWRNLNSGHILYVDQPEDKTFGKGFKHKVEFKNKFYGVAGGRLLVSENGADWSPADAPVIGDPRVNQVASVNHLAVIDGTLYAATGDGVYAYSPDKNSWEKAFEEFQGVVYFMAKLDGRLAAARRDGVYIQDGGGWKKISGAQSGDLTFRFIHEADGKAYVGNGRDLFRWIPQAETKQSLNVLIQVFDSVPASTHPSGETAVLTAAEPENSWTVLSGMLEKELGLAPDLGKREAWRKETAEILRNSPGLDLEKAMADSFRRTYRIKGRELPYLETLFSGKAAMGSEDSSNPSRFRLNNFILGESLYSVFNNHLYVYEGSRWKLLKEDVGNVYEISKIQGKIYVKTEYGNYTREGDSLVRMDTHDGGVVKHMAEFNGKSYLATAKGLYLWEEGQWKGLPDSFGGTVDFLFHFQGELYALAASGLYVYRNNSWKMLSRGYLGTIVVNHNGRIYARISEGRWRRLMLPPKEWPEDWKDGVLEDIGQEISRAQKIQEEPGSAMGELKADGKGNILGDDGRTLFSGFQAER